MKRIIPISSISIAADRQRKHFDEGKMHEFADGIQKRGLLHAIILRDVEGVLTLVAGERRLRAVSDLAALGQSIHHDGEDIPLGSIPYTLFTDLDPIAAEEAELEENLHRENLTWQEKAAAIARLTVLRTKQAVAAGTPPPNVAAIALEVKGSAEGAFHETTRRELLVAKHLDNPAVKAAKDVNEAFKILRKEEAKEKHRTLGAAVGRTFTSNIHDLHNEDSLAFVPALPSSSFDVILSDPPYGMGADEFGDSGGRAEGAHAYADDHETFMRAATLLAFEGFRITKEAAHAYIFCDPDKFSQLKALMVEAGWKVFRTPLIWYKKTAMRAPWPEQGPQRKYETILYAVKGNRPTLKIAGDVLDFAPDSNLGHGAQKPVALFQELLSRSALPGDSVIDPFCGTGPIFPAAHALKCKATGVEMDAASYGIAVTRLENLRKQAELDLELGL